MQQKPLYQRSWRTMHCKENTECVTSSDGAKIITTSKLLKTPFNFDSLIISPCALVPQNSTLLIELQIMKDTQLSPWLKIAQFEYKKSTSFDDQMSEFGRVSTDYFICADDADGFKYRITLCGKTCLFGVCITATKKDAPFDLASAQNLQCQGLKLNVKPISQMANGGEIKNRICSPTCLTMLLNYYGVNDTLQQVCSGVYDSNADIYGNWLFNTMYAGSYGLDSYATRLDTFEQAYDLLSRGNPVICSISFENGELENSPQPSTPGHLVLLKGFDKDGNVIVNDPAAKTDAEVERTYNASQFANAWLRNKKGLIYLIKKQEY